ncbi:MAG: hypothetical protein MOB07_07340 [Acidobacteria bacterium]|nr:hypothetical protein [Acidobacteriota bacterium]
MANTQQGQDGILRQALELPDEQSAANIRNSSSRRRPEPAPAMEWLRLHRKEYGGQWVALDGSRLIAHGPFDDRSEEFQWLAQNSGRFHGEWVALSGKRLLAHNVDYNKVSQEVKSLNIDGAMFMFIEGEGNEDFVRFLP